MAVPCNPATKRTLTRRRLCGITAGGAAGLIALRLGLPELLPASAPAPAPTLSGGGWPSPLLTPRGLAAHLLRRAGFAPTEADLEAATRHSYADLVDSVVNQQAVALPAPTDVTSHSALSAAWYEHMATTGAQFPERMALFWHGVLTSDYRNSNRRPLVYQQNVLFRQQGRSDLRSLLTAVTYDPLMMRYLNLDASTAEAPNENYSRELMELFTLGPGNYTEADVREGARALSGIRIALHDSSGRRIPAPKVHTTAAKAYAKEINALVRSGATFRGTLTSRLHDDTTKTFLGRTGNLGPEEVIDTILSKPACAPFVVHRAMISFATPSPSSSDVNDVAAQFRSSGYDIRALMRAIFRSPAFTNPANYRSLVRTPTDFMVAAMRATGRTQLARACLTAAPAMDQVLYEPPSVAGWPSNAGWVSSGTLLARLNFASTVTIAAAARYGVAAGTGAVLLADPSAAVTTHLDGVLGADTLAAYRAAGTPAERWYALLAGPEFQLK